MKNKEKLHTNIAKVCLTDSEYAYLLQACSQTGLSISAFLRNVALNTPLPNKEVTTFRLELLKTAADMGRLGGLLKMAISNGMEKRKVQPLLDEITERQKELKQIASKIK